MTAPTAQSNIEYPMLGEPVVVEFVNSLYIDSNGAFDFLGDLALARGWFMALSSTILDPVDQLTESGRLTLLTLRSAIRAVFDATPESDLESAIAVLEATANASPASVRVTTNSDNQLTMHAVHATTHLAGAAARLAVDAIELAAEDSKNRVLVCDRPACHMHYLQHHRRRRYCNAACANADRQFRFQERHKN